MNNVNLVKVEYEEKSILRNLLNLYEYDVSEFNGSEPNRFGFFEYLYLDHYWTPHGVEEEGRVPYFIKVEDNLVGFTLLNNVSCLNRKDITSTIAEFYILKNWRRKGIGKAVALQLFRSHPGKWEVAQERENKRAQQFWGTIISEYTNGHFEEVMTEEKVVLVFDS